MATATTSAAANGAPGVPLFLLLLAFLIASPEPVAAGDTNNLYEPCGDTAVQRSDGFTFGIAFASKDAFFLTNGNQSVQLSPCDRRLSLLNNGAQLAMFRPKVDEISLLTVNTTTLSNPAITNGGFMVAFAGRKYAARSPPAFVGNNSFVVTSFTLVLEFQKGRLQNLYWKRDGCSKCKGNTNGQVCLNGQDCAFSTNSCKSQNGQIQNGQVDCSLGIQLAFSGTDKHYTALNSWYEVSHLRQYSLFGLYSNLRNSLTDQYNNLF
ncbi:hypothetical protein Taro_018084 [Colocasia esculenta]|uniref:Expp1 protein n=1 Tax=Colocasia esculenta TaxID=4460 RepID=A0A843V1E7_COLES|nr:hypothetical protein [Colocasia esculenta]